MVNLNDYLSHETIKKYRGGKLDWEYDMTIDMDTLYKLIVVILLECVPWYN